MKLLLKKNYLSALNLSEGIKTFKHVYADIDGKVKDIVEDGDLACAEFACFMLLPFKLISEMHATVAGAVQDLKKKGWYEIQDLKEGAVLIWEKDAGNPHMHIGFYLGNGKAVSNSSEKKESAVHDYRHKGREVSKILWHDSLN
jgi:hypothetical protein